MNQERKQAARQDVVKQIHETVDELERLLSGAKGPARPSADPREDAFWSSLERFEEERTAKAGLLSELIELVLPFDFMFLLVALRGVLHNQHPSLEGQHVPDLAERQERFAALVADLTQGMAEHIVRLRRVGDSVTDR